MNLTRAKFDELTAHLVERTAGPVNSALNDAGMTASELSKVLLVGGSTRIPAVQDKVQQLTGKEPFKGINPDECVAIGASVQGGKLAGDAGAGDILLLDVTPLSTVYRDNGWSCNTSDRKKYNNPYKEEPDLLNSRKIIRVL